MHRRLASVAQRLGASLSRSMGPALVGSCLALAACSGGALDDPPDPEPLGEGGTKPTSEEAPEAEVLRDARGVPHIFAADLTSAMRALGRATAEDRMLQMEIKRRVMRGTLAAAFGPGDDGRFLALDRQNRTMGYARHAEAIVEVLPAEERALLEAYADGVNAHLASTPVPSTVGAAGLEAPATWSAADCLLSWDFVTNYFGGNIILGEIQKELAARNDNTHPDLACQVIDEEAAVVQMAPTASFFPTTRRPLEIKASHSWVISGARHADGEGAVLNTNPQWMPMAPGYGYEYHLSTPDLAVRGLGFAGTPGFLVFFNEHIAIGGSSAGGDTVDLFALQSDGADGYLVDGEARTFERRTETIEVKGGAAETIEVRDSVFGPVVSDIVDAGGLYAARHIELWRQNDHTVLAALRMMQARDLSSYREAVSGWAAFCLHTIYGDREGNIAYQPACHAARRDEQSNAKAGRLPFDGSTLAHDWDGVYDVDEMPHVINPPEGYIFTANHLAIGASFPHYIGFQGSGDTNRSQRLRKVFEALLPDGSSQLTSQQVRDIQSDAGSESVRVFRETLRYLDEQGQLTANTGPLTGPPEAQARQKAWRVLQALELWDRNAGDAAFPGPQATTDDAIFPLVKWLADNLPKRFRFKPGQDYDPNDSQDVEMKDVACTWGGAMAGLAMWQKAFEASPDSVFGSQAVGAQFLRVWHVESAAAAYDAIWTAGVPVDPSQWAAAPVTSHVPFQYNFLCMGGGGCSISSCFEGDPKCSLDASTGFDVALKVPVEGTIRSQAGQGYVHFVDTGAPDSAGSIMPVGTSEDPTSPTFRSTEEAWMAGELFPAPLHREAVEGLVP